MNENEEKAYRTQNNALDEVGKAMESFKLALGGMVQSAGNMIAPHFPAVDIRDYADHYLIDIDLPGLLKKMSRWNAPNTRLSLKLPASIMKK